MKVRYAPGLEVEWTKKEYEKIREIKNRGRKYTDMMEEWHHRISTPMIPYLSTCLGISEANIKKALKGYAPGLSDVNDQFITYGDNADNNNREGR